MSRVRFLSTGRDVGDCHVVTGTPFLGFPFRYSESVITDLAPLQLTRAALIEWWWRVKEITVTYSTTGDLPVMPSGVVTLTRRGKDGDVVTERDLCYPGADSTDPVAFDFYGWEGSGSGSGGGADWGLGATVRLCAVGLSDDLMDVDPEALLHRAYFNGTNWMPTLTIRIQLDVAPDLFNLTATSYVTTQTVDFLLDPAEFLVDQGGDAVEMGASVPTGLSHISAMSALFEASKWYEYENSAGAAVWDENTGAPLLDHRQYPI